MANKARLTLDMNFDEHSYLKMACAKLGVTMRKFMLLATFEKMEKIEDDYLAEKAHQTLMRIAGATGGKLLEPSELETELGEIRDRSVQIPDDITESLWDSRLVFVLFVLMISIEWGLRKAFGLL